MRKRLICLILPVVALILELLPYGAVCNFANPEGEPWRKTFSYFSMIPFGYANFAPLLTAAATCLSLVLLVIYCVSGKRSLVFAAKYFLCVTSVLSLGPLVFGIEFFSFTGGLISAALFAQAILLHVLLRTRRI